MQPLAVTLACVTFFSTGLGGLAAIRFRDHMHLLLGFSSGAVLGVALFEIIPEIFNLRDGGDVMPFAAIGFLFFFALERYTAMHRAREHEHAGSAHTQEFGILVAAGLSIHSFLDGVAIGVGFQTSIHVGLLIALAVISHDLSDGLNTVTVVLAHENPLNRATFWLLIDALAPVVGALSSLTLTLSHDLLTWLLAFFVGSFLFIGASDLLPEAREHNSPWVAVATAGGMLAMYLTTRAVGS
ncbi:MAG TPA: ZIP family metal transporter [Candidatus Binataceae bacterium]|nr:ZIP family metal transporter [Candidatus Binataceae bacterium]